MKKKIKELKENLENIKKQFFFRDPLVLGFEIFPLALLFVLFFIIFLGVKPSGVLIQLRYNSFYGVTNVGSWYKTYNLFVVGIFIYIVNSVLAYVFYTKERLASFLLLSAIFLSEIILIIEATNIVKLINS